MTTAGKLDQGRESFRQQTWAGAYALLSSADQVPRSVGEDFGQVSAQFRELGLEELGQTPPRLVEHVVARLSDSGAVTGEFMSKAVRALGAQASVPSEVPQPEDVGPDDPASAAGQAFIAHHPRAPYRTDQQARGRVAVLLASDRYLELHERLSAAAATPPTTEAADQQASQALPRRFHKAWRRRAKRPEVVLEDESALPGGAPDAEWHQVRAERERVAATRRQFATLWPKVSCCKWRGWLTR